MNPSANSSKALRRSPASLPFSTLRARLTLAHDLPLMTKSNKIILLSREQCSIVANAALTVAPAVIPQTIFSSRGLATLVDGSLEKPADKTAVRLWPLIKSKRSKSSLKKSTVLSIVLLVS